MYIVQSLCRYKQIQELCLKKQFQYNNPRHAGSDGIIETWESNISNIYYVRMVYFNAISFLAHSHDQERRLLAHLYKCSENAFHNSHFLSFPNSPTRKHLQI